MINVKLYTYNKNEQKNILFECNVYDYFYEITTDVGNCYANDFILALEGKFKVEVFNKKYETEVIEINSNDWVKNIENYINYIKNTIPGVFAEVLYKKE